MPCEVVLVRVDFFKMAAVAIRSKNNKSCLGDLIIISKVKQYNQLLQLPQANLQNTKKQNMFVLTVLQLHRVGWKSKL
jgi:hypothetical protein